MDQRLIVGTSPHVRADDDIRKIMWRVVLALSPAVGLSIFFFGLDAARLYALCILAAVATELACLRLRGKPLDHLLDGSACVTALLLAMLLPASAAWYVAVVGGMFAIAIGKQAFGGLGNNIWNPALVARIFLQFAYPSQVSLARWPVPARLWEVALAADASTSPTFVAADVLTTPTPLAAQAGPTSLSYLDMFFGNGVAGCLGETCKFALLIGGVYLILRRVVDWRVPVLYIGTVFLLTWLLPEGKKGQPWDDDPLYHILAGGLFMGAFFMATDMVTTPVTRTGRAVFAVGCGLLTAVIRRWGGYPEGVCYSIVLMNTLTPLIDRWVRPRVYGSRTPKPGGAAA